MECVGAGKVKYHSALSKAGSWLWVEMRAMLHVWDSIYPTIQAFRRIVEVGQPKQTDFMLMVHGRTI